MFIPDPSSATKEGGGKIVLPFCSHKYHKIENFFEQEKKKFLAS
jgi:hypothetical protein